MYTNPSLITRIAIGKLLGFLFGLSGFLTLPYFYPVVDDLIRWGILLWYTTVGAFIGIMGIFNYHPIFKISLPWWFRAPFIGAWMNFTLTLFTYELMSDIMVTMFGEQGLMTSPFWFVAEGAIIGLLIGYVVTRFGGEGKDTLSY